jgi:hypothetical protein
MPNLGTAQEVFGSPVLQAFVQGAGTRRYDAGRWCLSEQPKSGVPENWCSQTKPTGVLCAAARLLAGND